MAQALAPRGSRTAAGSAVVRVPFGAGGIGVDPPGEN